LRDFKARGHRDGSVRSYAHVLLRWWRFLQAIGVVWDRATPSECRDFVLWLQQARKPISDRRTRSATRVGTVNPVTRKQHLTDQYAPRTVRHSNAVLRAFYEFWIGKAPVRWSTRYRWTWRGLGGHTLTTTRCSRFGPRVGCGSTRRFPATGHGRCQTSGGTSCSER
jgi:hypothetical protein